MKSTVQVASPPASPIVVYDGDCGFCRVWIRRWRQSTAEAVEYVPFQDPRMSKDFPELPREHCERAVQLIDCDGTVYSGAEAAFRALASNPHKRRPLETYHRFPLFARAAERFYAFVAGHRRLFSTLTRLGWGTTAESPQYQHVRDVFLRSLGLVYLVSFLSLWVQVIGLIGADGILPANITMKSIAQQADRLNVGLDRYHLFPTLCWVDSSDTFLKFQCAAGIILGLMLLLGIAPAFCLFVLWLLSLSLSTVCREFFNFQWDTLLLETGFVALFFAPLQALLRSTRAASPSRVMVWLLRWLLFRLMFESGCVKLLSQDVTWRQLTALNFHYETQPLPTWIGWYAHQLPGGIHQASTVAMFAIELVLPFFIFGPRRLRQVAAAGFCLLQVLILLTGNYCFFNLLTLVLCIPLLDDAGLRTFSIRVQSLWRRRTAATKQPEADPGNAAAPEITSAEPLALAPNWPQWVSFPIASGLFLLSALQLVAVFTKKLPFAEATTPVYRWLAPFRSLNTYGLFAVMTTERREIVLEGSDDQSSWLPYEFKYKPGDLNRRPTFVAPHQPRLDWQMWFAALGDYQSNPWFVEFCLRLLRGSPETAKLLERNPFPDRPPRYLRALVYEYHFTDFETRKATGQWWRRELKGIYLPPISLRGADQAQ